MEQNQYYLSLDSPSSAHHNPHHAPVATQQGQGGAGGTAAKSRLMKFKEAAALTREGSLSRLSGGAALVAEVSSGRGLEAEGEKTPLLADPAGGAQRDEISPQLKTRALVVEAGHSQKEGDEKEQLADKASGSRGN